jgi:glutamyl-tRNA reductase
VQLALIHQPAGVRPVPPGATLWRTCLRDIAFVRDVQVADDGLVTDADAYALLLEVVCGLRSPLAGETEVQAQFKTFLSALDPTADRDLVRLGQRILADAKTIRCRHLQGVGVQAYSALAVGFVPSGRLVVLLGTGALASDLSDALSERHEIAQWGRKPYGDRPSYATLSSAHTAGVRSTRRATIVVAAPIPSNDVDAVAACYPRVQEVIDLRGSFERAPLRVRCRLVTLDDLFREGAHRATGTERIADARREIHNLSRSFGRREEMRPFGWDDLSA